MDPLSEIVQLTEQMRNLAMGGEWEQMVSVEKTRQQKLMDYYAPERLTALSDDARSRIEWLMQQNQKIMTLCRGARSEVIGHLGRAKQAKQMTSAYGAA